MIHKDPIKKIHMSNRKYRPVDNSHARCITKPKKESYLAGTFNTDHEEVEIVFGPYTRNFEEEGRYFNEIQMVIVKDKDGDLHDIMYYEHGLIPYIKAGIV
jgi:hypothetical protein